MHCSVLEPADIQMFQLGGRDPGFGARVSRALTKAEVEPPQTLILFQSFRMCLSEKTWRGGGQMFRSSRCAEQVSRQRF